MRIGAQWLFANLFGHPKTGFVRLCATIIGEYRTNSPTVLAVRDPETVSSSPWWWWPEVGRQCDKKWSRVIELMSLGSDKEMDWD